MDSKNIVLLATGSFNPPTNMHLRMFGKLCYVILCLKFFNILNFLFHFLEIARDHLNRLGFTVCGGLISPTHDLYKKKDLAPSIHRCAMIEQALVALPWVKISDWEVKQSCWTKTRNVLEYHKVNLYYLHQYHHFYPYYYFFFFF